MHDALRRPPAGGQAGWHKVSTGVPRQGVRGRIPSPRRVMEVTYAAFHLIEQPMLATCACGACPVRATWAMASYNSRRASGPAG